MDDYIKKNRQSWDKRVEAHLKSAFYDNEQFLKGKSTLNDIELGFLGNLDGKSVLHLQCHFGQDTISLSRLGAQATGVDFSGKAIETARELTIKSNTNTQFVCCDIYELPAYLEATFDIVFTSYGTIGWLPDMDKWAAIVARFLKPGGKFVFVEFHPVVWMFDDDFKEVAYSYFNTEPIIETTSGTYADRDADIQNETVSWNHDLSEVISSLLKQGLQITSFKEYDYSPYNCFNNTVEVAPGRYKIEHLDGKIPMVYALSAMKV